MGNTFVTVFLIIIAFSLGLTVDFENKSIDSVPQIVEENSKETETFEYKSPFGFSFKYDEGITLENTSIVLPGGNRVSSVAAVRYVREQKCSESGLPEHCRAFLENPAVAFGVIDDTFESLKNNDLKDVIQFAEPITIAEKTGIQYYMGVEGEGIVTVVLPFKNNQTFLIQYTFDEMYDQIQKKPEILGSKEQKAIVDKILSTLKIN